MTKNNMPDKSHFPFDPDAPQVRTEKSSFLKDIYLRNKLFTDNMLYLLLFLTTVTLIIFCLYIIIVKYIL